MTRISRWSLLAVAWLTLQITEPPFEAAADDQSVFYSGGRIAVVVPRLDQMRREHSRLDAEIVVADPSGELRWRVDLSEPVNAGPLMLDASKLGKPQSVRVEVRDAKGDRVFRHETKQLATIPTGAAAALATNGVAPLERGSRFPESSPPKIMLPDMGRARRLAVGQAPRVVKASEIRYPVYADRDLPSISSENCVIASRSTFAPDDATKVSVYFSYRKPVFDAASTQLKRYIKMLVEVPLDRDWLRGDGDMLVELRSDQFAVHATDERERDGQRWDDPAGHNMLGESSTGLYQGGQSVDIDEQGRIYISNVFDGAGLVRFDPRQARFEQPPVNVSAELRKFLPSGDEWRRGWDQDLAQVACRGDRVYLVFDRNYRVTTPNGKFETCSGAVSIPQDDWNDAERFRGGLKLLAGSWPTAPRPLFKDQPIEGKPRRVGVPSATTTGIVFGNWRLDLDSHGETQLLAQFNQLTDPKSVDGRPLPPTSPIKYRGLNKQKYINVGGAGRAYLQFSYGQFSISRAELQMTLPPTGSDAAMDLADASGKPKTTFPGAPNGEITVRFDIAGKILEQPKKYGQLAQQIAGLSQGPNYGLIALPDAAGKAIGVCEYSYFVSMLDFSRRAKEKKVFKSYLPMGASGHPPTIPINLRLGPYNTSWVKHDSAEWLYVPGYTGIARVKFRESGKTLDAFQVESIHQQLKSTPLDGRPRDSVKDFLYIVPTLGGKLIDIGRGRPGRGGGAYSAGLELFDPSTLGASRTCVAMNRCYGLFTPVSRVVHATDAKQSVHEIYVASGLIKSEYVDDLPDASLKPAHSGPKVFCYRCDAGGDLADLYGFALPELPDGGDNSASLALSPDGQYLIAMQQGGALLAYQLNERCFVDAALLSDAGGQAVRPLNFSRPTASLWTSPDGRVFFHTAMTAGGKPAVGFYQVAVSQVGRLNIAPMLTVTCDVGTPRDFDDIIRCFMPDLDHRDGSYDLVLGGPLDNGGQPTVRVIDDFIEKK